jgi:hypothetical protein
MARDGVTFRLHMCRGSNRRRWFAEGGYDRIAEWAFGRLRDDRFLLEYDSERAGDFAPLRFVAPARIPRRPAPAPRRGGEVRAGRQPGAPVTA